VTSSFLHDLTENSSVTAGSPDRFSSTARARVKDLTRPEPIGPFVESHALLHAHAHRNKAKWIMKANSLVERACHKIARSSWCVDDGYCRCCLRRAHMR
jgi:hypothetical protein